MFLKVDNVGAELMCSGRLFQATGRATQNVRLPSCKKTTNDSYILQIRMNNETRTSINLRL